VRRSSTTTGRCRGVPFRLRYCPRREMLPGAECGLGTWYWYLFVAGDYEGEFGTKREAMAYLEEEAVEHGEHG